jgi:MFS family permease
MAAYGMRLSYGVFFKPMGTELQFDSATTALAFSISMFLEGVFSFVLGGMADRFGPRKILSISALLLGLGYFLLPLVHSAFMLALFYGIIIGTGMGGIFVPTISMVTRWFTARRNLISGLVSSGVGVGAFIMPPLCAFLIDKYDWRASFMITGALVLVVVLVSAQFLKRDPSVIGAVPFGESGHPSAGPRKPVEGFAFKDAIRTSQFWIVLIMLFTYGFYSVSVTVHIVPDAINLGMTPTTAANILAVSGIFMLVGRILLGGIADRIGNRLIFIFSFSLSLIALLWITFSQEYWVFFVISAILGFTQGGIGVSQSPVVASLFGLKSLGLVLGCIGLGCTLGAALGPFFTGYIFDVTGDYQPAFIIGSIMCVISLAGAFLIRPHKNRRPFAKL